MLVLSRKVGERINVGDNVTITIVKLSPTTVRIGIDAPDGTPIVRQELMHALAEREAESDAVDDRATLKRTLVA